jgi:hypothetical protein
MGVAFYLTSLDALIDTKLIDLPLRHDAYNGLFTQAGLFVLAFGLVLTGPGPLSVDRAIFRRKDSSAALPENDES